MRSSLNIITYNNFVVLNLFFKSVLGVIIEVINSENVAVERLLTRLWFGYVLNLAALK